MRLRAGLASLLLLVVGVTACESGHTTRPTSSLSTYRSPELTFHYPASWNAVPRKHNSDSDVLVSLSTEPQYLACPKTGPDGLIEGGDGPANPTCDQLVHTVGRGGVFATWAQSGYLCAAATPGCSPIPSDRGPGVRVTRIGGFPALVTVERPGECARYGIQGVRETLAAEVRSQVPLDGHETVVLMTLRACLGGSHLHQATRDVQAMLDSVRFRERRAS
jgi:hypothetical protein